MSIMHASTCIYLTLIMYITLYVPLSSNPEDPLNLTTAVQTAPQGDEGCAARSGIHNII